MKKYFYLTAIAAFTLAFASCSKENEEAETAFKTSLVGKWKTESVDGKATCTNYKNVHSMKDEGSMTLTTFAYAPQFGGWWLQAEPGTYTVGGDNINFISSSVTETMTDCSVSSNELKAKKMKIAATNGGFTLDCINVVMKRVSNDFSKLIVGNWQGVELTGEETYGAADHVWSFHADGSYIYYTMNNEGKWEADPTNTDNMYFVDGDFYGSQWKKNGTEYREWWDIDSCDNEKMVWSAIRQKSDGTQYRTTLKMKRLKDSVD